MNRKMDPQRLVSGVVQVASLPMLYRKVEEALASQHASSKYLSDIISEDTAMAARLLRLANSALYSFPSRIETVSHAVTVIGARQLRELVLASSVVGVFEDIPAEFVDMESFWRHSVACAVVARILAGYRREANVEAAFVAGLLHDIGRLVIYKEIPNLMKNLLMQARQKNGLLYQEEREQMGFHHGRLGGLLLKEWKLPPRLVEAVAHHHEPARASEFATEVALVHVADVIANAMALGSSGESLVPPLDAAAWDRLGLEPDMIESLLEELELQYSVAVDFVLGVDDDDEAA